MWQSKSLDGDGRKFIGLNKLNNERSRVTGFDNKIRQKTETVLRNLAASSVRGTSHESQ